MRIDSELAFQRIVDVAGDYEFHSFVLGVKRPRDYQREKHEALFRQLKIDLGSRLTELWPGREVDFERPDIRFDVSVGGDALCIFPRPSPLFIGGRYRKLSRQIPACRWKHQSCRGRGCPRCDYTGNVHGPSIQELAEPAVLRFTRGTETFFHGSGREDVDARMLGDGRPFVIEVRDPHERFFDFQALAAAINQDALGFASVHGLGTTDRESMVQCKASSAEKSYRTTIEFDSDPPADLSERLASLSGHSVSQLSPTRVMRRRGEHTLRRKEIIASRFVGRHGGNFVWEVRTSSGTYVKELVSGDDGRTQPSVASVTEVPCRCIALDVVGIHWSPPWE